MVNIQISDDAKNTITSINYGSINEAESFERKFYAKNIGSSTATSVIAYLERLGSNDGLNFGRIALDVNGIPGTWVNEVVNLGSLAPGAEIVFWVKVSVGSHVSPVGNPRQFNIQVQYTGT